MICLLLIVLNLVNTTGEYILDTVVVDEAARAAPGRRSTRRPSSAPSTASYFFWVNVLTALVQALLVSRIVKYLGLRGALLALPIVALGAYGSVIAGATSSRSSSWAKTAENATDYSMMNTARQMLWLPTSREEKYKAKQAADTFIVRIGDVLSAGLVFAGTSWLGLGTRGFAGANLVLVGFWLLVAFMVLRENRALSAQRAKEEASAA